MLQDTVLRLTGLEGAVAPTVVSNDEHRFLVAEQLREIGIAPAAQILEPVGRNTAPAVAVAALRVAELDPGRRSCSCSRRITDSRRDGFPCRSGHGGADRAGGSLVTFGIAPIGARDRLRLYRARRSTAGRDATPIA